MMIKKIITLSLILVISISSCKKTELEYSCDNYDQSELNVVIDGDLQTKFNLQSIQEFQNYANCISNCTDDDLNCIMNCTSELSSIASGGTFSIACHITNKTKSPINFTIKAGEWFTPTDDSYQPMLCPKDITISVKANKSETQAIPVYCLASHKKAPSAETIYSFCNQNTSSACINDIMDILKTKDLESISFTQAIEVQGVIWDCTNDSTNVDLSSLNDLPNL